MSVGPDGLRTVTAVRWRSDDILGFCRGPGLFVLLASAAVREANTESS